MFEKVNPAHPDKIADRIAGALVDLAYSKQERPRIAVEVLIGHGTCSIIAETSVGLGFGEVSDAVERIAGCVALDLRCFPQDPILSANQDGGLRCGDNGIFRGVPLTDEQRKLSALVRGLWTVWPTDGKYVMDGKRLIACQSCMEEGALDYLGSVYDIAVNPLGPWTGGPDVDTGATNRKLGSDMGDAVTGGGLHGKDLSKADVSANIVCHILAQRYGVPVEACCAIGDASIVFRPEGMNPVDTPYPDVVETARGFVLARGGFEKLAEWGLV